MRIFRRSLSKEPEVKMLSTKKAAPERMLDLKAEIRKLKDTRIKTNASLRRVTSESGFKAFVANLNCNLASNLSNPRMSKHMPSFKSS
jgi:hypothetical protein